MVMVDLDLTRCRLTMIYIIAYIMKKILNM
nr:MAG TPA: hypothetical protein [Caudoviricetes sp.]